MSGNFLLVVLFLLFLYLWINYGFWWAVLWTVLLFLFIWVLASFLDKVQKPKSPPASPNPPVKRPEARAEPIQPMERTRSHALRNGLAAVAAYELLKDLDKPKGGATSNDQAYLDAEHEDYDGEGYDDFDRDDYDDPDGESFDDIEDEDFDELDEDYDDFEEEIYDEYEDNEYYDDITRELAENRGSYDGSYDDSYDDYDDYDE